MINSPEWFNLAHSSVNVTYSNINISAVSTSSAKIANTDGWDIYRTDKVVIKDSVINNGDDCVSFKPSTFSHILERRRAAHIGSQTLPTFSSLI